jgi:hypothetical protein
MFASKQDFVEISQYIRTLHGGSQPILVQASDGLLYVAKFANNLQGVNLLFNESAGTELYRACGLVVPSWKPLLVTDSFLDRNPDCWMQTTEGQRRPNSGLCFGSRFVGAEGVDLFEILPETSYKRIRNRASFWLAWLIDICALHSDNRQAVFMRDSEGVLDAYFVDNGHLFGGPKGEHRVHFQASRYLDPSIYPYVSFEQLQGLRQFGLCLDVDVLWHTIQRLPDDWKTVSALNCFEQCLIRLSTPKLLQNIAETMVQAQREFIEREESRRQNGRKPPLSVLRTGIQAAELEYRLGAYRAGYSACAYG